MKKLISVLLIALLCVGLLPAAAFADGAEPAAEIPAQNEETVENETDLPAAEETGKDEAASGTEEAPEKAEETERAEEIEKAGDGLQAPALPEAPETPEAPEAPELEGCVAVNAELATLLQKLMDKYTFEGVDDSWTKLCFYYQHLGA